MIEYKTGDLLTEDVDAIVNTVNCVGVMGRGIALQFKKEFPDNFKAYAAACKHEEVRPGRMFVYETGGLTNPRLIINFPTKRHWRGKSRMDDIESGLDALIDVIAKWKIRSIAIPPLGSDLGGLDWSQVRKKIEKSLCDLKDVRVIVFEPWDKLKVNKVVRSAKSPKMTAGRAALVELIRRYLGGLLDPFVSLLEVHKLMYFLQEAGEPLRLAYSKGPYGPYAENLRHVLNAIEGYMIVGYEDGGDDPNKQLKLVPKMLDKAETYLKSKSDTQMHLERVFELVEGFESPFGLELLSTVHWVVSKERCRSLGDVTAEVYAWGDRKKQFSERQIELAVETLANKGWFGNDKTK